MATMTRRRQERERVRRKEAREKRTRAGSIGKIAASAIAATHALLLWAGTVHGQPNMEDVEGKWAGTVSVSGSERAGRQSDIDHELQIEVQILGEAVSLSIVGSSPWALGSGRITRLGASAIIFGPVLNNDSTDTWALTLTKQDADSVLAFLSRIVRREGIAPAVREAVVIGALGELRRVTSD